MIVELIVTILAWRKGWRWRVLLPWGVAVVSAILLGAGVAASGGEAEDVRGLAVLLELGMLGALVFMACRAPGQTAGLEPTRMPGARREANRELTSEATTPSRP